MQSELSFQKSYLFITFPTLTPSKLAKRLQMAILDYVSEACQQEKPWKARRARAPSILDIVYGHSIDIAYGLKRVILRRKMTHSLINLFETDKTTANNNLRLCLKLKPKVKYQ